MINRSLEFGIFICCIIKVLKRVQGEKLTTLVT
jgi:hypothetical protein